MAASAKPLLLLALLCVSAYTTIADNCVYTFFIKTGTRISGGTNSVISATLFDSTGDSVQISDIETWGGLMGTDYDYFERGNVDIFSGLGTCTSAGTICALNLTSDGSGSHPGWYVNYAEVTITGANLGCTNVDFEIEQWIADDAYPYELYAYRDSCSSSSSAVRSHGKRTSVLDA
ncbi:hypothetical protein GOP47_0011208 [Adiantum capillus-veneris]|uniref:PLAT domain-containing protein n=1 Tax=Adiantum capillus-veneris TaxID=13818 RepID=A0A9D4ZHE5_ADICA|nr:hypothetical protein GOP47_0011208 [Adiantum capillus-veneris]